MRYIQRRDGEGWNQPAGTPFRIACCDCGLVHDVVIIIGQDDEAGQVGIAVAVNNRATAQRRRKKDRKP